MVEDGDGSVWMLTAHSPGSPGPLCHATDREVRCFGKADGLPIRKGDSILLDGTGGFWIGSDTSLVHWKAGVSEVYELQALRSNSGQGGIQALVRNSDGSLWVGIAAAGRVWGSSDSAMALSNLSPHRISMAPRSACLHSLWIETTPCGWRQ